MNKNSFIQKIVSWALLLVFTISVTPKKYFHDTFAHRHTDTLYDVSQTKSKQFANYQYNCGFVNVVVTKPFTGALLHINLFKAQYEYFFIEKLAHFYPSQTLNQFSLRGPPVA